MAKIERDYPIARLEGDVERICNEINVDIRESIMRSANAYNERVFRRQMG